MKRNSAPDSVNLTPMIDIVFQLIIFFVFTLDLEREKFDKDIEIPMATNPAEIKEFEPATVYPQVLASGNIKVGSAIVDPATFRNLIRQAVKRYGQEVPVMVYGAAEAKHSDIRKVMDICSEEGLYKINILGVKERSSQRK
jgi:biopolymer transport protein ExbD